jgi:DNA-binding phage protein
VYGFRERFAALNGSPMCESFIWGGYLAKHNKTLRADEAKVSNLLARKSKRNSPVFEEDDVMLLLRVAVEREGGQTAFAKRHGVDRSRVNRVLSGNVPVTRSIARALGLRRVYVAD